MTAIDVLHTERMATLEAIHAKISSQHILQAVRWPQAWTCLELKEGTGAAWLNHVHSLPLGCTQHENRWPTLLKVSAMVKCLGTIMKVAQDLRDN
jgi:hypothetical protein